MCSCLLLFGVLLLANGHKGLHVQGPSSALWVQLGDTVVLPCFAQSPLPLDGLQVEWRKTGTEALVNVFKQGESRPELQSPSFRGRAHFFADEVSKGNFSIVLKNVAKKDAGIYRCKVNTFQESSQTLVEIEDIERLVVTGADRAAIASVGEDVILNCSVDSHLPIDKIEQVSWRRTDGDILVLLYQDNETFPESSHERYQGRVEFFTTEIPKGNFSLKLKDVKMEDKGEFICEVHSSDTSGHTIVVLQSLGFSVSHILVLMLCLAALLLAVGLCVPVFIYFRQKVYLKTVMKIHISLILCPNICMCAAFILLYNEVSPTEVVICSVVCISRPLLLLKTSPYLSRFPQLLAKALKSLALPVYHSVIATTACSIVLSSLRQAQTASEHIRTVMLGITLLSFICSVISAWFALRMHSTMVLVICNGALLGLFLSQSTEDFDSSFHIPSTMAPLIIGMILILSVQRHFFQGKPFGCWRIAVSTVIVTGFSLVLMILFVLIGISLRNFARAWMLLCEAVIFITAWVSVIFVLQCCQPRCCSQQRGKGYLCCAVVVTVLLIAYGGVCLYCVNIHMEHNKDRAGYIALTILVHVLAATAFFKHPTHLPDFPHMMIYMFGAVGLNIVSSVTIATELNMRAGKGTRAVEDLRVIVLLFETVFVSGWLALQIYDSLINNGDRIKSNFEDQKARSPQVLQEMVVLSASVPS